MQIQGLQKLTLLDYPGKMAATVFTAGCNFRCPFCHNASLVTRIDRDREIPTSTVLEYLNKRKNILEGVCISGGEPLLQPGLTDFIKEVKALGYSVKLDTNGSNLGILQNLVMQSLIDYVAMDIKNIPGKYRKTSGLEGEEGAELFSQVKSVVYYLKSDVIPYEFRTTLVKELHEPEDLEELGSWLRGAENYYLQKFNNSGDLIKEGYHSYSDEIMLQALEIIRKYIPTARIRG
jgi:pyruvate formate lyase activating enzyme